MNLAALLFFLAVAATLWSVPRRWAPLPLLIGCCHMTMGQGIMLGSINLPIFRMLLIVGLVRVFVKGELLHGNKNRIDMLIMWWSMWVFFASFFHEFVPGSGPQYTLGVIFNITGVYILFRCWSRDADEVCQMIRCIAYILAPVAIEMAFERFTGRNLFSTFGGVPELSQVREGSIRAQGPFGHAILAGTVGATCLPLMIGIWRRYRNSAFIGVISCLFMVFSSASSGPIMSMIFGFGGILLWYYRPGVGILRWLALGIYLMAELCMSRPAYYLISKIDLSGGSTGWHRSRLIEVFIEHFSEWWFVGTDHTRHWMPYGVPIGNGNHIDITNYYISFGVLGGLVSLVLVIVILVYTFRLIGSTLSEESLLSQENRFLIWSLGASMFAHVATGISVAYFDQSMIFFWLDIAVIGSIHSSINSIQAKITDTRGSEQLSDSLQDEAIGT